MLNQHGQSARSWTGVEFAEWTLIKSKADALHKTPLELCELGAKLCTPQQSKTFPEASAAYSLALKNSGASDGYISKMVSMLKSMAEFFQSELKVHELSREQIESWLLTKKELSTRKYALQDARTFYSYAKNVGWSQLNPCENIPQIQVHEFPKGILTPEQARVLLDITKKNDAGLLRYFSDQLFGGLREDESAKLKKSQTEKTYVYLPKTKIGQERFNEFNEIWLRWRTGEYAELHINKRTKKEHYSILNLRRRADDIKELAIAEMVKLKLVKTGWKFPRNCLRHSFCTYGAPIMGAEKTAKLAGHTEKTQRAHYRRPIPLEPAQAYWQI
jgi:site-specific recombinase XerD